ncbi:PREDICTED: T-cell immunoreceptor with Ig and ITIM domains [Chinchilla lanigera]|uniref:T-cell immunoreceptor with Ig and ITIM domains n=1 Tax=Chinchilla lanigera TaxID=34839 RepID=A0A8C2VQ52_CHILA|nr:PREDICTED: T-cell immunoreceptor with Ig and ITIM domains [Chinchilla lanigera]
MRWCLFLIWAHSLRQAARLTSESVEGTIVTQGNILAKEGGSVVLQCYFSSTTANVTQVNWEQQDQLLAIYHPDFGWYINPVCSGRVSPGPSAGLTFHSLTMNDTGEYFCIYHTYPDGIYRGRIFLEVRGSSVGETSTWFQILLLGAVAAAVGIICATAFGLVALARKKKLLRIHSVESSLRGMPAEQQEGSPSLPSCPGSCVQAEAAPAGLCGEQKGDDYAELHEYFNVLSYRSLGSFGFPGETG